jgi:hypothetical protein
VIDLFDPNVTSHMSLLLAIIIYWEPFFNHLTSSTPPLLAIDPHRVVFPHVSHAVYRELQVLCDSAHRVVGFDIGDDDVLHKELSKNITTKIDAMLQRAASLGLDPLLARASGCNVFSHEVDKFAATSSSERCPLAARAPLNPLKCPELLLALAKAGVDCANIDRDGNNLLHRLAASTGKIKTAAHKNAVLELVQFCRDQHGLSFFTQNKIGVDAMEILKANPAKTRFWMLEHMFTDEEKAVLSRLPSYQER